MILAQISLANTPSVETISVIVAGALVWVSALVQHLTNVLERGPEYVMGDRSVSPPMAGFFGRATRTLANNIEAGVMWIAPTTAILIEHHTSWLSQCFAAAYIGARFIFAISYWFKIRVVRSVAWLTGMVCCASVTIIALVPGG